MDIEDKKLEPGTYNVTFEPIDEESGSDAIEITEIKRL